MIICFVNKINTFSEINKKNLKISQQTLQDLMPTKEDIHCACPTCGAKNKFSYHSSYERNFSFLDNDILWDVRLSVTRAICNSCGHTHACFLLINSLKNENNSYTTFNLFSTDKLLNLIIGVISFVLL